jgi:hypothetical protein
LADVNARATAQENTGRRPSWSEALGAEERERDEETFSLLKQSN